MSIKEIEKNKKYRIEVVLGYNGKKKIRHTETFNGGKKEAIIRENQIKVKYMNNASLINNKMTINDLSNEWLKFKKDKLAPKTYSTYALYSKNIVNGLGHIKLKNLNTKLLEDFYTDLKENTTFSDRTIKHHYQIINNMLVCAKKWGYIENNPNENTEHIKVKEKELQCYTPDEVHKLIQAIEFEPIKYQAIILLALDTGARRGELTGLTWDDIDLEKPSISINKITQYSKELGIYEKEPKNKTSNRKIYISETTCKILRAYEKNQLLMRMRLGGKWGNSKRVFTTDYGYDMHPDTPSKILTKIIKKYNLRYINFHALRHTSISLQANSNIPIQLISKRAGHSNVSTTHKIYSHYFDDSFKEIANTMNEFLTDEIKDKNITG